MDTVDLIFNLLFLVFGVILIAGTGLIILIYKIKHPEEDLNYKTSVILCLLGLLFIIGAITGYTGLIIMTMSIFIILFRWYGEKKYPEKYHYLSLGIWDKIFFVWFILWFIFIIVLYLVY